MKVGRCSKLNFTTSLHGPNSIDRIIQHELATILASNGGSRFENRFMIGHDNGLAIKISQSEEHVWHGMYCEKQHLYTNVIHVRYSISLTNSGRENRVINYSDKCSVYHDCRNSREHC